MNIDITNYGHYRLTSHGGRSFELFNRKTDKVYTLDKYQFAFIKNGGICSPEDRCEIIEEEFTNEIL